MASHKIPLTGLTDVDKDPVVNPRGDLELWRRIQAHEFDKADVEFPFSMRLAEENGWTDDFAQHAIREYRRFVFLACIADHEVTPSDEVDQVWHLHLAYTRDYWERFCGEVLRRPLHHRPTEGGIAEQSRYEANYLQTLALYQETFAEPPPLEFWPPAQIRFDPKASFTRVNKGIFTISPQTSKRERILRRLTGIAAGVFALAIMAGVYDDRLAILTFIAFGAFILVALAKDWMSPTPPRIAWNKRLVEVRRPQHGYWVRFTMIYGTTTGAASLTISPLIVTSFASERDSGEGGGGGGCGGGGCGGGCGGC